MLDLGLLLIYYNNPSLAVLGNNVLDIALLLGQYLDIALEGLLEGELGLLPRRPYSIQL